MIRDEQIEAGLVVKATARDPDMDQAHARDLAARLPELRSAPGFPAGADRAILAMSIPRSFTACPNPYGADLVQPDDAARADRTPYATDLTSGKGHPIYKAHSYPTKVPHEAIMRLLLHYTEPGDLVLDGFCGSGMTGVAAQACGKPEAKIKREIEQEMAGRARWGVRRAYLQDLGPGAAFIAAGVNLPFDAAAFASASARILDQFDRDWGWMYRTKSPDGRDATIDYTVWSEVFTCPRCAGEVVFYDVAFDEETSKVRDSFDCSSCGATVEKHQLLRRLVKITTLVGDAIERIEFRPVRISYRVGGKTGMKHLDDADLAVLRRVASTSIPWVPTNKLPLEEMTEASRVGPLGISAAHHFWGDRALAAMAVLWEMTGREADPRLRHALRFWVEQALWGFSWMNRHKPIQFGKPGGSAVNNYQSGAIYVPALHAEPSVRYNLEGSSPSRGKRASLVSLWRNSPGSDDIVRISTGSSSQILLQDDSVDYIFVDPPFGRNFQYSDLAVVIESWHGVLTAPTQEAVLDSKRHKGLPEYTDLMTACFREFYRVLRPGRWMTVEFSNSSNAVWLAIQSALSSVGFVAADTRIIDKEQLTHRQVSAANAIQRDLVISAYKPRAEVTSQIRLSAGSEAGVWAFIREHLGHLETISDTEIRERQADRLFDRVVAYHVANGIAVPMGFNEFREGIDRKFNRADGMYFLPSQEEEYQRFRLTVPRTSQETAFITNESSAVAWIRRLLDTDRRTYSEIMPAYFKEVQTGLESWEAMPELRDLLSENFLQDDEGRWFIPDTTDAAQVERLHNQALLRIFAEYANGKGKLGTVRSEAIRVGFAKAWNDRDFESIYAVGRRLPEDFFVIETALHHFFRAAERHAART